MKQVCKSLLSAMLILCVSVSSMCFAAAKEFPDARGHWAEAYIKPLTEKGAIDGFPDGNFRPNEKVTLQQFVKIIISANFGEIPSADGNWASGYLDKALALGLIASEDLSASGPMDRFTAVRIVNNALINIYKETEEESTYELVSALSDYPVSCNPCREPFDNEVAQCYAKGIITGKPGPVFDGEAPLTRAEASAMIMRMIDEELRIPPERPLESSPGYTTVSPEDAKKILEAVKDTVLLDVRDEKEHNAKYIPGSICIPLDALMAQNASQLPDKELGIIVYCQVGARSQKACEFLVTLGYLNVYHLGGIDDWPYETASQ